MEPKASPEEVVDSLADELSGLDSESALAVVSRWLAANKLEGAAAALATEVEAEPSKWGSNAPLIATTPSAVARDLLNIQLTSFRFAKSTLWLSPLNSKRKIHERSLGLRS